MYHGFVKEKMGMAGAVKILTIKVAKTMIVTVIETATVVTGNGKLMRMMTDIVEEITNKLSHSN